MSGRTLGYSEAVDVRSPQTARELTRLTQALVLDRLGDRISAEAVEIAWHETGRADFPWVCRARYRVL